MIKFKDRQWLLFSPILLAYFLHGAKTGLTLFVVFSLFSGLFLFIPRDKFSPKIPFDLIWPFGLFFLWCAGGLLNHPPLDLFLTSWIRILLYIFVAVWIYQEANNGAMEKFEAVLLILGSLEAILICVARFNGQEAQLGGMLKNSLHSGLLLPISFSVALLKLTSTYRWDKKRWAFCLLAIMMTGAVVLIRSRMGLLAMGAVVVYNFYKKWAWVSVPFLIFIGIYWLAFHGRILDNLEIDPFNLPSTMGRFAIWQTAFDAIRSRPFLGWGLGNFETAYRQFQHPSAEILRYGKWTIFAHNGFLQVGAEAGVPGLMLLVWGWAVAFKKSIPHLFRERFLVSTLLVFFMTSLINYSLFLPFHGMVFATTFALLMRNAYAENKSGWLFQSIPSKFFATLIFVCAVGFLASVGFSQRLQSQGRIADSIRICPIRSDAWYEMALVKLSQQQDPLPELDRALSLDPSNSFFWQRRALVLMKLQPKNSEAIENAFSRAQTLAPFHAPFYVQEGFYRLMRKELELAFSKFKQASELEPIVPMPHMGLALAYVQQGKKGEAQKEFEAVKNLIQQKKKL